MNDNPHIRQPSISSTSRIVKNTKEFMENRWAKKIVEKFDMSRNTVVLIPKHRKYLFLDMLDPVNSASIFMKRLCV